MVGNRPHIPAQIKRSVRRRCGFGCVVCGCPIITYEHVVEWSETQDHGVENLTLLCDAHHRQKTSGMMGRDTVVHHNESPFNLRPGTKIPYKLEPNIYLEQKVSLGSCEGRFSGPERMDGYKPITLAGFAPITAHVEDNFVLISALFYDDDGQVLFQIDRNEVLIHLGVWDIEWIGSKITIRSAPQEIALRIDYSPEGFLVERAHFRSQIPSDPRSLEIRPNGDVVMQPGDNIFSGMNAKDCGGLINLG